MAQRCLSFCLWCIVCIVCIVHQSEFVYDKPRSRLSAGQFSLSAGNIRRIFSGIFGNAVR
eukprot:7406328-Pyramimonas_sp.AAC.1